MIAFAETQQDLQVVKIKFYELSAKYPQKASITVFGATCGPKILEIICGICDYAIRALNQQLDVNNCPISEIQIANGLQRLVQDARQDTGLVAMVLNVEEVRLYGHYLDELEQIARHIHSD
jgi:hypothetical protein